MRQRGRPPDTTPLGTASQYRQDLALFRTVMAIVNSSPELDHVLRLTLRTVLRTLGPSFAGMILLHEPEHPGLAVVAHEGLWAEAAPKRVFVRDCPCSQVMETGMPTFEAKCPGQACHHGLPTEPLFGRLVAPLKTRQGHVAGTLCVFCPPGYTLETTALSLWDDIGTQIGRAIEDSRSHTQLQQTQDLLQRLYDVSDHLATSLDLEWVLSRVLELSMEATEAREGSVVMLPGRGTPAPRVLRRDLSREDADQVIDRVLTDGLAGWVVRNKEGTIITNTSQDGRWLALADDPSPTYSALAVPLIANDQVLGVITLSHGETDHFEPQQMGWMRAIAYQASLAIEKAQLHNEVTHLAEVLAERVEERTRELKETQAQLVQAEKLAALGELAAGVAHEINNPLHILQAYVEHMGGKLPTDSPFVDFLNPMHNALDSIARLAGQLRDFSRPAGGEWKPLNVNRTLENVLRLVNKEMMHCQIEIEDRLSSQLPTVTGDIRQLEQVFLNLILNARDAMPGGGRLAIETYATDDRIHIRFADTGVGIREEDLERIFEPYFTTKEDRGTGLGLAICQRIITQHGGKISVTSRVGEGTVMILHLPASRQERAPSTDADKDS